MRQADPGTAGSAADSAADGWIDGLRRAESAHHDARSAGAVIDTLVVHAISLPPGRFGGDAVERLFLGTLDPDADPSFAPLRGLRVSAHFVIGRDGAITQYVDCDARAWHAGVSRLLGRERCNDFSIGIELEGDNAHPFEPSQYARLTWLVQQLRRRYPLRYVVGHADIAPVRKTDPGPHFDWPRWLATISGLGLLRPQPAS